MPRSSSISLSLSALALAAASPALADVTAAELWAEWQAQGAVQGQVLSAEQVVPTSNGLSLRGFTTTFEDADVRSTGRVDELLMVENGDGTVTVTMSDVYNILIEIADGPGDPDMNIALEMRQVGLEMLVGGTVEARSYNYSADTITITEGELSGGGGPPPEVELLVTMRDLDAEYLIDGSNPEEIAFTSSGTLGTFTGAVDIVPPPPEEGRLKSSFLFTDLSSEGGGNLGSIAQLDPSSDSLPEGFELLARLAYGGMRFDMDFEEPSNAFEMAYTNLGGAFGMELSETVFNLNISASGTEAQMSGAEIPVPISVAMESSEIAFDLPVAPAETPTPFSARLAYQGVTMGEPIWSMFDPGQAIPRDPITIIADVSGAAQMMVNLLQMDPDMDAPPGELRELTINELVVSAGGAELTGSGDLDFAPGQIVPMPVGRVDLALSGGFGLMDRLQSSGLLPAEQMMMVRGMTGVFARPGAGPDTLESTIEFTPGGGITANGMPIQ